MPGDEGNQLILLDNRADDESSPDVPPDPPLIVSYLLSEYTRWVLWLPVFLGTGVIGYFWLPFEPPQMVGLSGVVAYGVLSYVLRRKLALFVPCLVLLCIALGFFAAQVRTMTVQNQVLDREIGPTRLSGRVVSVEPKSNGARLLIEDASVSRLEPFEVPDRIRVTVRYGNEDTTMQPGDWVTMLAVLRPPSAPVAPGAFDFQRYAYFKGIGATGFALGPPEIRQFWELDKRSLDIATSLERARFAIGDRIRSQIPGESGALAAALITGERLPIPEQTVTAMRQAGLAHLLAISGLHIGLVAGLVFFVARAGLALIPFVAVRYPIKTWAALSALSAALIYTFLAGATIPTIRSFTMMALILGAVMIGRRAISMRTVAIAAFIIILLAPEALLGPSFQLSFAAVTALVAGYELISARFPWFWKKGGWLRRCAIYLTSVAVSTLIAGLATAPFAAYHFHQLASYGMLANLIAVPLTALWIMPAALLAMLAMPFHLEWVGLALMGRGVEYLISTAYFVSDLPGNLHRIPVMSLFALGVMTAGGLWLCLWQRSWRLLGVPAILLGVFLGGNPALPTILVSENAQLFAILTGDQMHLVGPGIRGNRFTRDAWLERAGYENAAKVSASPGIQCDHMGCILNDPVHGQVALIWDEGGLLEDCWSADVLISAVPVRRQCDRPDLIVDRFDVWRNGAYAIYLEGTEVRVQNTREERGRRPWTRYGKQQKTKRPEPES